MTKKLSSTNQQWEWENSFCQGLIYHFSKQTTQGHSFLPVFEVSFGFIGHQKHDFWESMSQWGGGCIGIT